MKVTVDINVICPSCGSVMTRFTDYVACQTKRCGLFNLRFERPSIELRVIFDEPDKNAAEEMKG